MHVDYRVMKAGVPKQYSLCFCRKTGILAGCGKVLARMPTEENGVTFGPSKET